MIWICAATGTEAAACRRAFATHEQFEVVQTGVGLERASRTLREKIKTDKKPSWIISTGFAGALDPGLLPMSWITTQKIFLAENTREVRVLQSQIPQGLTADVLKCGLISSPELTIQDGSSAAAYRKILARQYPQIRVPLVVDMESAALADFAEENEIAFAVVRMITDSPEKPLPQFVSTVASAMAASSKRKKVRLFARGAKEIATNLGSATRLARMGLQWSKNFEEGWRKLILNGFLVSGGVDDDFKLP